MNQPGASIVELFIQESESAYSESQYIRALAAADRAVQAAEDLGDPVLLVRALDQQQSTLRMTGNFGAAMVRCTRILAMAEDPSTRHQLSGRSAAQAVAQAYMEWVEAAWRIASSPLRELLGVLDVADKWLITIGHYEWRAGLLHERAEVYLDLDEIEQAINTAQEALVAYNSDGPGFSLGSHRELLGRCLAKVGHYEEAQRQFHMILDDPRTSPNIRTDAHIGLAHIALSTGGIEAASRHASEAVRLGENCGAAVESLTLNVMVQTRRATGDLDEALKAARRQLETARRTTSRVILYDAIESMIDVALDRHDITLASELMTDLEHMAEALDSARGSAKFVIKAAELRGRFEESIRNPLD